MNGLCLLLGLLAAAPPDAAADAVSPAALDAQRPDAGEASTFAAGRDGMAEPARDAIARSRGRLAGRVLAKGAHDLALVAHVVATDADGRSETCETDDDGRFELRLSCGVHTVVIRSPGYETLSVPRDPCGATASLLARLVPRPDLPVYETVVVAPRDEPSVEVRGPELITTPGALGDPFRTVESLPGVAAVAWPAPIYAIRGSNPGNTGYFLDDLPVPALFHLALGPAVFHPELFHSIAFYPGGYPTRYGRYVAGVVAAESRAPPADRVHGVAELRLYDAGALASAPLPDRNGSAAAAFRYSYTGALLSLLRNDLSISYWDYQLRLDRRWRAWRLTILAFGSDDELLYHPPEGQSPPAGSASAGLDTLFKNQQYLLRFHRLSLRASAPVGAGEVTLRLALGADRSAAPLAQVHPIRLASYSILPRLTYQRPSRVADVEVGADAELQWFAPQTSVVEAGGSDLASRRMAVLAAAYAAAAVRAGNRLSLTPGVRLDTYTIGGVTRVDLGPRLSARLALGPRTWLVASGGRFSQTPSLTVQIPAAESFGLALYGLQTSWQGAVGVGTRRLPGVEAEVTGYLQRYVLTDLRDPALVEVDPLAGDFLVRRDARSYGVEVLLRRPASERLHGWLAYTWSRSQRALGGGLIGPSDWDQRHILNLVVGYRIGRTTLGARGHLHTGRPVLVHGNQADAFVRLPTFYQLDLRVERRILFDAFTLIVYAEAVNATLSRQVYGLSQDPTTGEITQASLRVFLPSLGVRGEL